MVIRFCRKYFPISFPSCECTKLAEWFLTLLNSDLSGIGPKIPRYTERMKKETIITKTRPALKENIILLLVLEALFLRADLFDVPLFLLMLILNAQSKIIYLLTIQDSYRITISGGRMISRKLIGLKNGAGSCLDMSLSGGIQSLRLHLNEKMPILILILK